MNHVKIPLSWGVKRKPRTELRKGRYGRTFDELFDYDTLFNDAVRIGDKVLLFGPPLYELKKEFNFGSIKNRTMDKERASITEVQTTDDTITLYNRSENIDIAVSDRDSSLKGLNCIVAKQRNEPLNWLSEWVQYYYSQYNVRGFVFYNNNCTTYSAEEMKAHLQKVSSDITIIVLDYNVPFGPGEPWMHDYCEYVMLEHFKYKYGWCANTVLHHDIDELLVTPEGVSLDTITGDLRRRGIGGLLYGTYNVKAYSTRLDKMAGELSPEEITFADYYQVFTDKDLNPTSLRGKRTHTKWMAIPELSMNMQWMTHGFNGSSHTHIEKTGRQVYMAHFWSHVSNNKVQIPGRMVRPMHRADAAVDEILRSRLNSAFSSL